MFVAGEEHVPTMTHSTGPLVDDDATADSRVGARAPSLAGRESEVLSLPLTFEERDVLTRAAAAAGAATPADWVHDALVEAARAALHRTAKG